MTDRKLAVDQGVYDAETATYSSATPDGLVDYYIADVVSQSDYFPFGMLLPNTNIEPDKVYNTTDMVWEDVPVVEEGDYRYGYQGSEMDNEVKDSKGTSYTTEFRQLDPRVGRWLSVDPKAGKMPWQSTFCSMDNSPIRYNDIFGDEVVNPENEMYQEYKSHLDQKISGLNIQLENLEKEKQERIAQGQGTRSIERQISQTQKLYDSYLSIRNELTTIEESEVRYEIRTNANQRDKEGGYFGYDAETNTMTVNVNQGRDWYVLAHELKHAYQFETGNLTVNRGNKYDPNYSLYDIYDEVEAFERMRFLGCPTMQDGNFSANFIRLEYGYMDISMTRKDRDAILNRENKVVDALIEIQTDFANAGINFEIQIHRETWGIIEENLFKKE